MARKTCKICEVEKSLDDFYYHPHPRDRRFGYCKECHNLKSRENNLGRPERVREVQRESKRRFREDPKNRLMESEWKRNYRIANQEKVREYNRKWRENNKDWISSYTAKRQADKKQATPNWADMDEIRYVYSLAQEKGHEVDHIVPLTSDKVCGLHIPDNLRVIPKELNIYKSNRYWPDMPKEL